MRHTCQIFLCILIVLLFGCSEDEPQTVDSPAAIVEAAEYIETGDIAEISQRGALRLIAPHWDYLSELPRQGTPAAVYHELAEQYDLIRPQAGLGLGA